ncbi:Acetyl-CoA:oxalate CoA-transferase [Achromobacter veterisilvae]|uniref:Acetyl-CoA:oxalate CoA-transferase n=1 Tax=Achromobacter veterisilvae TaxID=2069367 RepID=A0A446CBN5_9BURK|nr:CoA transferase [Achromobacter veterisilvae]SSW65268.1 Acetyl-CoA:oxalate CoA-transferase [Achromobacter veterisilvae]
MSDSSEHAAHVPHLCNRGALEGIRVIDLSRVLAGPLCTQILADQGADVIKVEPPDGDETRTLGPAVNADGDAAYFTAVNRGKRSIAVDLSLACGREALLALLEDADVLIENFLPGTMARWGLDYETGLRPRFPQLIYCAISGFGEDGPLGGLPGYDAILQAMCGLMSVNGAPAGGPTRIGIPIVDHLTGYTALSGILLALYHRARTGRGQRVEATLFDTALSLLVPHAANWMHTQSVPGLLGSAHPNIAPYDRYPCRDGEVFLGIVNDRQFRKFCGYIGQPALSDDERYATNRQRLLHRDALRAAIEAALHAREREAVCRDLMQLGVPAGPVNSIPEAFEHAHTTHRGMRIERGGYHGIGAPIRLSEAPARPGRPPPAYAQHTDEVLREAGLDDTRIAALNEQGALPRRPPRKP